MSFTGTVRVVVMATAIATVGSLALAPLTADFAHAQGNSAGKDGGGGKGGAGNRETRSERTAQARGNGQGRGALASELKWLNAAHASPQALANASPDSMPGRLAVFKESYQSVYDAKVKLDEANDALALAQKAALPDIDPTEQEYIDALDAFLASPEYLVLAGAVADAELDLAPKTDA